MECKVNNFWDSLLCPVQMNPLTEAVALFPCCHKVNEIAAKRLFGSVVNDRCELKTPCVVCRETVTSYYPDPIMRGAVSFFLGEVPEKSKVLEQEPIQENDLPYPGKPATFEQVRITHSRLCRKMNFESTTPDSLLESFDLFGYKNGSIAILVTFAERDLDAFRTYIRAHQIVSKCEDGWLIIQNPKDLEKFFQILSRNNVIPDDYLEEITAIFKIACAEKKVVVDAPIQDPSTLLSCPKDQKPLLYAVNLFPCCHKVNEAALQSLENKCFVCKTPIVSSAKDHSLRELATQFFAFAEVEIKNLAPQLQEKEYQDQPFPGKSAVFAHLAGDWEPKDTGSPLCRELQFRSIVPDSLLENFTLYGYTDGTIRISIWFQKYHGFDEFLKTYQIDDNGFGFLVEDNLEKIRVLFRIIAMNNEIPSDKYPLLAQIIKEGKCEPVRFSSHRLEEVSIFEM